MEQDNDAAAVEAQPTLFVPKFYGIALLVGAIVLLGLWLVTRYVALDVARDMRTWQEKLNLIAESRAADVTRYVSDHFKELHTLSDNPSLQLYLTELQMMPEATPGKPAEPPAQLEYLRNLLIFTAQRGGYMAPAMSANIPANVETDNQSGLAVLNNNNEMVVSTAIPQSVKDEMTANVVQGAGLEDRLIDLKKSDDGSLYMGFVVPIFSIQGERNKESQVGTIVAIRAVDKDFFSLLKHPGVVENTLETVLVRADGGNIEFLTPLLDKSQALTKTIDKDSRRFVEARLLQTVGNFVSDMRDYGKKQVLATSRSIAGTPWTMIVKVEKDEALKSSSQNRNNMIAFFFLIIAIIALLIVAIWWHASSKRSLMLSTHYRYLATQAQAQERLLRLVSDNQPEAIFILDAEHRYQFANRREAEHADMQLESVAGKHVQDVRGTARARHIIQQCEEALAGQEITYHTFQHEEGGEQRSYRSAYVPVAHIPLVHLPVPSPGVLVVEQDITEVVGEREKRLQISNDLIGTLVTLVDRRDPFAANHSLMVSGLARNIAEGMELDEAMVDTATTAASLMNIGKIVVSPQLLTKTGTLTEEERLIIRDSMLDAAELVKPIHFEGPVYETLCQWQEKWDGSGTLGLKGEAILVSARILAVANTFVGMISPRSWRNALSHEDAIKFLMGNCGTLFDRRAVVALVHFIENQQGKAWLSSMTGGRDAA
ncbi:MAG: HD domain-containing phosphohydrolase [Alphaproteobacteria bacterium]|nr:HD domain-containing phosphohydrolase [Alphaproteobacteria bacterium]